MPFNCLIRLITPLFAILLAAFCGVSCAPHEIMPALPAELAGVPTEILKNSNVIVLGSYKIGRTPCEVLPDGTRRWARTTGFAVGKTLRGNVRASYIETQLMSESFIEPDLQLNEKYYVFFDADASLLERLKTSENISFRDAVGIENILAVASQAGKIVFRRAALNDRNSASVVHSGQLLCGGESRSVSPQTRF